MCPDTHYCTTGSRAVAFWGIHCGCFPQSAAVELFCQVRSSEIVTLASG